MTDENDRPDPYDTHADIAQDSFDMNFDNPLKTWRAQHAARQKEAAFYNGLTMAELAQNLRDNCNISDDDDLDDLTDRLMKQALLLDSCFMTALHQSGLGRGASLTLDTFKVAMNAQKLCRQTYDSLKDEKQTKEGQKHD